jgi:5-methylcytosine-specific restriction endonuclease McrA
MLSIEEYISLCKDEITLEDYLILEIKRVSNNSTFPIRAPTWAEIIVKQQMKCYYCGTDLRIIQQLIVNGVIKPRKRGTGGYSGLHFELDHKNCDKTNNTEENLVASCYYCNNDKSNTISCETFRDYFGRHKQDAFMTLFEDSTLPNTDKYRHHLK